MRTLDHPPELTSTAETDAVLMSDTVSLACVLWLWLWLCVPCPLNGCLALSDPVARSAFVHDVLFPYALSHVEEHLTRHYHEEATREDVRALIRLSRQDQQEGVSDHSADQPSTHSLSVRVADCRLVASSHCTACVCSWPWR